MKKQNEGGVLGLMDRTFSPCGLFVVHSYSYSVSNFIKFNLLIVMTLIKAPDIKSKTT